MSDKYDRQGKPLDFVEWGRLLGDLEYKFVRKTTVGGADVSTVWLGLDHRFDGGPPVIFETMIFGGSRDQDQERYCTEEEAIKGHEKIVCELLAERPDA